ncbi:hypothetical protein SAICODRAFT_34848 [Saitoella complicata NRRL Y-17804]|uniref:uncharacterized protein n=1 Tax=Saitoella complicata (strain BCRC 22490 / CBS 7301 / JCM 7358 / NBRC 10748 / NRRL Y-17804) TaxID=698492 RepID=UPI00086783D8|nr:uncharacterized protein SAICODRAFT_34848 [Saitoella complicata NRRL Y-17804]ODQ53372.1 hypothetical protein SAICODRAFT_34848 [Saitoella complicata NRRL Y-17804]
MSVSHTNLNPNNWHWVNKSISSQHIIEYFSDKVVGVSAEKGETKVEVTKVISAEGDCDVSQRKGKTITLFDIKLQLEYKGSTTDADDVAGKITVPELAHDTEEDEYVFEVEIYNENKEKAPVKDLVRTDITPQLRKLFQPFAGDLIAQHEKDIKDTLGSASASASASAVPSPKPSTPAPSSSASKSGSTTSAPVKKPAVNTSTLHETAEFQTSASELYHTFLDPARVQAWTRSPALLEPKPHGRFGLWNSNISGEFLTLEEGKKIEQTWRMSVWPEGHYAKLVMVFDQGMDSTVLRCTWTGVPVGQEDVVRENFGGYYVKPIKQTFGFGALL